MSDILLYLIVGEGSNKIHNRGVGGMWDHDLSRFLDVPLLLGHSLITNELEVFFPKFRFWLPIPLQFDKTYQYLGLLSYKRKRV